jgi:hypothetical protein
MADLKNDLHRNSPLITLCYSSPSPHRRDRYQSVKYKAFIVIYLYHSFSHHAGGD